MAYELNGSNLSLRKFENIVLRKQKVVISPSVFPMLKETREIVERLKSTGTYYGINTGVGRLAEVKIGDHELEELQKNIIRSHAAGAGPPLKSEEVRGSILLRANTLVAGYSGVRPVVIEKLIQFLNEDIIPYVPSRGSVGASGDLAPLAHIALALMGEGKVIENGKILDTHEVLKRKGIEPLTLKAKEGLSLINGSQVSTSLLALAFLESEKLSFWADYIAAMSFSALKGISSQFDDIIWQIRPYEGAKETIKNLKEALRNSKIESPPGKVQDAYSLRCIPQVHGTVKDSLQFVRKILEIEMNSVTDNPVITPDGRIISGGNFHGQPLAMAADYLAIAMTTLANIAERRTFRLLDPDLSGLPAFLVKDSGLNSGLMLLQVTQASLVSENKVLSHPASVDSIPTSADQEDFVSMSFGAALKARKVVENTRIVLAIELISAVQAIDFVGKEFLSPFLKKIYQLVRDRVSFIEKDRVLNEDIQKIEALLKEYPPEP